MDEPQHLRYADNSTSASTYDAAHGRDSDYYHHIAHVLNGSLWRPAAGVDERIDVRRRARQGQRLPPSTLRTS